jgi:hypothetical protein
MAYPIAALSKFEVNSSVHGNPLVAAKQSDLSTLISLSPL